MPAPDLASEKIIPVIMCGGAGTRLWPTSRENMPKQFVSLIGPRSTFQATVARISNAALFEKPVVITNDEFRFIVREQLSEIDADASILLEPERRDSGPAVAIAAALASQTDPRAVVLVLAADHIIRDGVAFLDGCRQAAAVARTGRIVTFAVKPDRPAINYGYIKPGKAIGGTKAFDVEAFVEKPDLATAQEYVVQGYLWNSGNFMFRADVMRDEITHFEPGIAAAVDAALQQATRDLGYLRLSAKDFRRATKKSIDYAVMERTRLAAVIPVDFGWSDIGSWHAVWDASDKDSDGNVIRGRATVLDGRNVYVASGEQMLTAVVGVDDVAVVVTDDAVLVVGRDKTEQIKELVDHLKVNNHPEAITHARHYRPWGYFQTIEKGPRYQVNRIVVNPGALMSLQKHMQRSEHWVVVKGSAEVTIDGKISMLKENESAYVPNGTLHRLANPGKTAVELIEVQVGSYLGEEDIIRVEED